MSEAGAAPDPGFEVTTRRCLYCGETYTGGRHTACVGLFKEVMQTPRGESPLDELPPEAEPHSRDPSRRLNQYVLVEQVGKGGMGTVWKAWDRTLTRWVAIKFLKDQEEEDILRFRREAKLAARLRHPNIAAIYEVGEAPSSQPGQTAVHYLAMEFIDGQSLSSAALPLRDLLGIFVKVARAIEAAHKGDVVHRDIKPQNIMVTRENWPYVMDFGLAKALRVTGASISETGTVMGTPAFMSPEQATGRPGVVDEQSDVYSLGATLYAVLCGRDPFEGETLYEILAQIWEEDPPPPRTLKPDLPPEIETIVLKAMAKNKADRYPTAAELADDLERYLANQEIAATLRRAGRGGRGAWVAVLAVVLAAAGLVIYPKTATRPSPGAAAPHLIPFNVAPFRSEVDKRVGEKKFRSAVGHILDSGSALPEREREGLLEEVGRECRKYLNDATADFCRNLPEALGDRDLAELTDVQLEELKEKLPKSDDIILPHAAYEWTCRLLVSGKEPAERLLAIAQEAVPFQDKGVNHWFNAAEEIAYRGMHRALRSETGPAQDAPREERERRRKAADELHAKWKAFSDRLDEGTRKPRHDDDIARAARDFPEELAELQRKDLDLGACLKAALPEKELERLEGELRGLEGRSRSTLESRQELLTRIVTAAALRALWAGKSEEQAVQDVQAYAAKLRKVGGPADTKRFGPRVQRVFELLTPKE